jgi:hypothetical protein
MLNNLLRDKDLFVSVMLIMEVMIWLVHYEKGFSDLSRAVHLP